MIQFACNIAHHADPTQLYINTTRLRAIKAAAGIGDLTVGQYQGEQTQVNLMGSVNPDGTMAISGAFIAARAKTERSSVLLEDDVESPLRTYRLARGLIEINRPEVGSRVAARVHKGKSPEQAWATELDKAIRRGLLKVTFDHSLRGHSSKAWTILGIEVAVASVPILSGSILGAALVYGMQQLGLFYVETQANKDFTGSTLFRNKRWSLFPGIIQPDRFITAALVTALPGLVKVGPPAAEENDESDSSGTPPTTQ